MLTSMLCWAQLSSEKLLIAKLQFQHIAQPTLALLVDQVLTL